MRTALDDPDPVMFLEPKKLYRLASGPLPDDKRFEIPLGKAALRRMGDDLTIIAYGAMAHLAAERLSLEELFVRIVGEED